MDDVDARIGSSVAGYRLEALIGHGGMSLVYLAEHVRLGRKVALKLLAPTLSRDESFRARFERESQRAAEIDHPNIIPIYDAGEADGELYIAMKYVAGADLKALIAREGALSVSRALFLLEQAAAALDAAHDRDLIHRDVKPANILVEEHSERVYVTDFGVVKHTLSRGQTKTGYFIGTTDYAAPEQIEARDVDARTDVYSLGCVLYECLSGSPPFDRGADVAVMHAHLTQPPPLLSNTRSDLPKSLDRTIVRAMAKDPDERYATCSELMQAARAAALSAVRNTDHEARIPAAPTVTSAAGGAAAGAAAGSAAAQPLTQPEAVSAEPVTAQPSSTAGAPPAEQPSAAAPPPPDQPSTAAPPPPDQPSTAGPPPSGRRGRSWLTAGLAAVVAAVAAGLIVFFVTRSDDEPEASPGVTTAAETSSQTVTEQATTAAETATDTGGSATTAEETTPAETTPADTLTALVPGEVFRRCGLATSPPAGATAAALCVPSEGDESGFPDQLELSIYPDAASLAAEYDRIVAEHDVERDTGRCNGANWGGERGWNHGPGQPGGRELCYFDGDDAVLVWSHEKLDQPNHHDLLGVAREGGLDHTRINSWWRFWTHRIGKTDE